jgi:hypothetical protein
MESEEAEQEAGVVVVKEAVARADEDGEDEYEED